MVAAQSEGNHDPWVPSVGQHAAQRLASNVQEQQKDKH